MNWWKIIICLFKGHDIDPEESIVKDVMIDKRNWICRCHRCGFYEMHDGAISGSSVILTKSDAERTAMQFRKEFFDLLSQPMEDDEICQN